jgi:hypothetical protein
VTTIRAETTALIRGLGELSAEQSALAQTALRLASAADDKSLAGYALAAVVKEYRNVLADLTTAPGLRDLVDDDLDTELRRLLRGNTS